MKNRQRNIQYAIIIGLIIVLNLIFSGFFSRIDLTKEKRYSLTELTEESLESLNYPMVITAYLEGDFPPNVREFQEALQTTLQEMKQYAGRNLEFQFQDPANNAELLKYFRERGFNPIPVKVRVSATEVKEQLMWPLIRFRYRDLETYEDLLKGASVMTVRGPNVNFAKAEANLEYMLTANVRKMVKQQQFAEALDRGDTLALRKGMGVVAFLQGHGEPPLNPNDAFVRDIASNYNLFTINLKDVPEYEISPSIDVLVIQKPVRPFSERDKYELDQYLIRGGSILWLIGQEEIDLRVFQNQSTLTKLRELNLDDLFLKYGLKINYDMVQDLECEIQEFVIPGEGGEATFVSRKWIFFPKIWDFPDHPIARNVDVIMLRYPSSIDTFQTEGLRKQVFLRTSRRSRTVQGVQFLDVNQYLQSPPPEALFNRKEGLMTGVVVEGRFTSLFTGRQVPLDSLASKPPAAIFGAQNHPDYPGRMTVISDENFIQPRRVRDLKGTIPYDNRDLILNAIDYLAGDEALTQIRSKEVGVRGINKQRAADHASLLVIWNLLLPILLIILFGVVRYQLRKRRNAKIRITDKPEKK